MYSKTEMETMQNLIEIGGFADYLGISVRAREKGLFVSQNGCIIFKGNDKEVLTFLKGFQECHRNLKSKNLIKNT